MTMADVEMEKGWVEAGMALWKHTFGSGQDDDTADRAISTSVAVGDRPPTTWDELGDLANRYITNDLVWCAKWVDGGCRTLMSDEAYVGAVACTKISLDDAADIEIPWPAFLVRLPPGLFPSGNMDSRFGEYFSHVRLAQYRGKRMGSLIEFYVPGHMAPICSETEKDSLSDALFDTRELDELHGVATNDAFAIPIINRSVLLAKRAVVGLLFALQHTNNWRPVSRIGKVSRQGRNGPPSHRSIVVGRPLSVNVASAVHDSCIHGHSAPAFQTLVRGHRKRQVIGIGRNGRKVIWVEPYWRGPEDAPILARPYMVGAT